jgi:protein-S-isoprenylcysteine O-methyltransferase Ste14
MTDPRHRGPVPPVFFLAALLLMAALHYALPLATVIVPPWSYLGAVLVVAGLAMVIVSAGAFARAGTAIRPFEESSALVVSGCYRFTRNPMYLGMLLVLTGVAVLLGSVTPFLLPPMFAWLIQQRFIRHEEAMLEERFGDEYRAFRARVRRWL